MDEPNRKRPYLKNLQLPLRLQVGDLVKVHNGLQSFWIEITEPRLWRLQGKIKSEIVHSDDDNQKGDIISFQPCNILELWMEGDD